jgi:acyl-coenzyme A thioesterase PaaI-like protein
MPNDAEVLTVELKVNLLAPASGDRIVAEGEVVRAGGTLTVCRGEPVHEQTLEDDRAAALRQSYLHECELDELRDFEAWEDSLHGY